MTRALEVVAVGPSALVQDLGRPGLGASGVGRSGAADRASLTLANRLVAILHGCLANHTCYDEHRAWHTESRQEPAAA